jgi:hypothetical protein
LLSFNIMRRFMVAIAALVAACSSSKTAPDSGPGIDGPPNDAPMTTVTDGAPDGPSSMVDGQGIAGEGGTPVDGFGVGTDTAGGACNGMCPAAAPTGGDCACISFCRYYECAGRGRVVAVCDGQKWTIKTQPCSEVICANLAACPAGKICVETQTGATSRQCVDNPCGSGNVGCSCAASACLIGRCTDQGESGNADIICSGSAAPP